MTYEIAIVVLLLAGMVYLVKRKKKGSSAPPQVGDDGVDITGSQDRPTKLN